MTTRISLTSLWRIVEVNTYGGTIQWRMVDGPLIYMLTCGFFKKYVICIMYGCKQYTFYIIAYKQYFHVQVMWNLKARPHMWTKPFLLVLVCSILYISLSCIYTSTSAPQTAYRNGYQVPFRINTFAMTSQTNRCDQNGQICTIYIQVYTQNNIGMI